MKNEGLPNLTPFSGRRARMRVCSVQMGARDRNVRVRCAVWSCVCVRVCQGTEKTKCAGNRCRLHFFSQIFGRPPTAARETGAQVFPAARLLITAC